ncbi:Conserved hypothetical protein [Pseudomonas viridiflava]|uniref:Uncharacterized protein n=1 Tax=Pseudomonas viridiflava TaxID=33069 RepID=A0A1Y6JNT7_PSEVI|nr:Conserved hypothetical protein [Pseudomonas viridiflava]VVM60175.1 hypothetical protein PS634_01254 [Pseudomonas fluorescens]
MLRPVIGSSLQTVMNMNRFQSGQTFAPGQLSQKMHQYSGIETAGETDVPDRRIAPGRQGLEQPGGEIMTAMA